jgi:hypothetical protein
MPNGLPLSRERRITKVANRSGAFRAARRLQRRVSQLVLFAFVLVHGRLKHRQFGSAGHELGELLTLRDTH